MPRIPDDYLGRNKVKAKIADLKKKKNGVLTTLMGLVIFIVCIFEAISFFLPEYVGSKAYKEYYFPLFCMIELFVFSLFFVFKAFRHTSCLDTKAVSLLMSFIFFTSIMALVFQFKVFSYLLLIQPVLLGIVLLITVINAIRWFLK